jgi:hypothetical protein
MTTIVAIFDNARDVDQAVTRLARTGFEDTVFDEGIIAGEAHSLGLVFASGFGPPEVWGTPETPSRRKPDHQTIVRAFKSHLADYHLPDEIIEAYAMTFSHSGEFLLVKTQNKRAKAAMEILGKCGATRVGRHELGRA